MASAREEIEGLIAAYAARIDAGDFDGVGRLFDHARYGSGDGSRMLPGTQVASALRGMVILHQDGTPRTKHVTTNLAFEIDEAAGSARVRSYYTVLQQVAGGPLAPIVAGRYEDRFERADGRWRFAERRIHVDLVGDLSRHLKATPPT